VVIPVHIHMLNLLSKKNPLYLAGPTGVGKSAFAIELALRLNGEVIGADAFQIYRGLPILTAQPTQEQQSTVPHHLIGAIPITEHCDAFRYRTMALACTAEVTARDRFPLITGGTGLYFRTLITPFDPLPQADLTLRAELASHSLEGLVLRLTALDPEAPTRIDLKNRRRVERALEIIIQTKRPLSHTWQQTKKDAPSVTGLLLLRDREELYQRIESNVQAIFDRNVSEEIKVIDQTSISTTAAMTLGLRDLQAYHRGEESLSKTQEIITQATKRYAKRQLTWFRNQHSFLPLNLSNFSSTQTAVDAALLLLQNPSTS